MNIVDVIARKRDGFKHTREEIEFIAEAAGHGDVADYQLSAWLMAVYIEGLDDEETLWLTVGMADSGARLDLSALPKPWLDKHSTGGVGDKTTLVVLPILAACGLTVIKMSGRGLGITGGTIDKLESIPGFRTDLSPDELIAQAKAIGLALTGQTPALAPADKRLYGLRDTTGTVSSEPLIVSSILSKKIAGGAECLLLDVKCGSGAFMRDLTSARSLAQALKRTGEAAGLKMRLAITDMSQPLGRCVGNALEVKEAIRVLENGKGRFGEFCQEMAVAALVLSGNADHKDAVQMVAEALRSGAALAKFGQWVAAQTAGKLNGESVEAALPEAAVEKDIIWEGAAGWVNAVNAEAIGKAVIGLGGGRQTKDDRIDHSVGIELLVEVGAEVKSGEKIAIVHAAAEDRASDAAKAVTSAIEIKDAKCDPIATVIEWLD